MGAPRLCVNGVLLGHDQSCASSEGVVGDAATSRSGLSRGGAAGVSIAVILFVAALVVLAIYLAWRYRPHLLPAKLKSKIDEHLVKRASSALKNSTSDVPVSTSIDIQCAFFHVCVVESKTVFAGLALK
mgnify:CR=1 FL=1